MGVINIPREHQEALGAIDTHDVDKFIEQAIQDLRLGALRHPLTRCGPYIATQLHYFEKALVAYSKAKAASKREQTLRDLRRAGYDLSAALSRMKHRMESERKDAELFFIEDTIPPPYRYTKHLTVPVSYRWRGTVDEPWSHGRIIFSHVHDPRPEYSVPTPKRKPSKPQQERDLQQRLFETWEYLKVGALCSVRDYFKNGGDGSAIPDTFQATVDRHSRGLNNFSTQFWKNSAGS